MKAGDVFRWSDTFCSRMVTADGPRIAPNSHLVSAYATTLMASQLPIGAYLAVPLEGADGAVLGTLCAVHPRPLPPAIRNDQPLVELQARLLASLLVREVAVTTA